MTLEYITVFLDANLQEQTTSNHEQMKDEQITITLPNGKTMSKVVNFIAKKRPHGWSRRSYASYYKEEYAMWLKTDIDAMIESRKSLIYRYDRYNVSANSLYLRVNQALFYLLDEENGMDKEGKYRKFRNSVKIRREPKVGIIFEFDAVLESTDAGELVDAKSHRPKWMEKMDRWLEDTEDDKPFIQEGLMLTPTEIEQIVLEMPENVLSDVTSRHVKIIKQ